MKTILSAKCLFTLILITFLLKIASAQDTVNITDNQGLKQGTWIGRNKKGKVIYQGTFEDGRPVGEMRRFHENGKLKALLNYKENGKVEAVLYNEKGKVNATGNYINSKKDSIWKYLDDDVVVLIEKYREGIKDGMSVKYYTNGKPEKETNWVNDEIDGIVREFFPSGGKKVEMHYISGIREGLSIAYFENGMQEIEGTYHNNLREGRWKFYNIEGNLRFELIYNKGKLVNPEVLDSIQENEFEEMERTRGNLKDPENYKDNPGEYMR